MKVYAIDSGAAVKVGIAGDPQRRLATLQTGSAAQLRLVETYECGDARIVERVAHKLLSEKQAAGEWFSVSADEAQATIERAIAIVDAGDAAAILQGLVPTSFAFTPAEKAEIDEWADELGVSRKEAILEAVRAARRQGKMTNKQLLAEIERRLK